MKTKVHTLMLQLIFLFSVGTVFAQMQTPLDIALRTMESDSKKYELSSQDISDVAVSDKVFTQSNEMTNIYFVQRYEGIEIYNAIMNFTISKEGKVIFTGNRFIKDIAHKVNGTKPVIGPEDAIMNIVADLGGNLVIKPRLLETKSDKSFVFEKGLISHADIPVKLRYQKMQDGSLRLAWDVAIDYKGGNDYWSIRVDALTGKIIDKKSFTVHCKVRKDDSAHTENVAHPAITYPELLSIPQALEKTNVMGVPNQYNVFAFPLENPRQGNRTIQSDPADPIASPFGWHDTNGVTGADFTITRGNNVHAYEDRDADYASSNDEPDGTASLNFDFPINLNKEPDTYTNDAVVQLFYVINFMHDFTYKFGFDEYANFQDKNYTNTGVGADHVVALSQFDAIALTNINNADFSTPADGGSGRVRMFLWDNSLSAGKLVHVNAPNTVAGAYGSTTANYGADITFKNPITGDAIIADDGSKENPSFACNPLANGNGKDMPGKIVLIDRGGCEFGAKSLNAQNNGAIGVIICNFDETTVGMAGGAVGGQVTIPTVMLRKSDCEKIKIAAGNGLNITFQAPDPTISGPQLTDGSLDNGIMAHEFGHGVSTRLTGGPANSGCLGNAEQMGEGWSDFLALVSTVKPWDNKLKIRGIGNFVTKEDTFGNGIRTYPYSTDLAVNPHTYGSIISNSEVHFVGEVWTSMLWDLYWAFVDKYGFDASYTNVNSGSYKAVKLVIDALKIQPCGPGFVDGRNSIIAADQINYGGVDECLIWQTFARRGLGYYADEKDPNVVEDAVEDFSDRPICLNKLFIKKTATDLINAGDEITYLITVSNYKSTVSKNVIVTDNISAGLTYVSGSASNGGTVAGNVISFNLGDMASEQIITVSYKVKSSAAIYSVRKLYDDCELLDNWDIQSNTGSNGWNPLDVLSHSPTMAFSIEDAASVNSQDLYFLKPYTVTGTRPVLRFYQLYETQAGVDGGFVEISEDGTTFTNVKPYFIRHGYTSKLSYGTFVLPNLYAFSGSSGDWVASYIDLTSFIGKTIKAVRFRFGSDATVSGVGWFIDDLEYMDLKNYNSEACVTSMDGDMECASAPEEGTIVESQPVSTTELKKGEMAVYPNPSSNVINISLKSNTGGEHELNILSLDGKVIQTGKLNLLNGNNVQSVDVSAIPSGCYIIKIQNDKSYYVNKIVLNNK